MLPFGRRTRMHTVHYFPMGTYKQKISNIKNTKTKLNGKISHTLRRRLERYVKNETRLKFVWWGHGSPNFGSSRPNIIWKIIRYFHFRISNTFCSHVTFQGRGFLRDKFESTNPRRERMTFLDSCIHSKVKLRLGVPLVRCAASHPRNCRLLAREREREKERKRERERDHLN